jgi:hypothetical protein
MDLKLNLIKSQKYQLPITEKEKFSREEQLENTNLFESIEEG